MQRNFNEGSGGSAGRDSRGRFCSKSTGAGMGKGTELRGTANLEQGGSLENGSLELCALPEPQESTAAEPKPWGGRPELRGRVQITGGELEQKCAKSQGEIGNLGVRM